MVSVWIFVAFGFVVYQYLRAYLLGRRALSFIPIESIRNLDLSSLFSFPPYNVVDTVIVDVARDRPIRSLSRDCLELHLPSRDV